MGWSRARIDPQARHFSDSALCEGHVIPALHPFHDRVEGGTRLNRPRQTLGCSNRGGDQTPSRGVKRIKRMGDNDWVWRLAV